MEIEGLDLQLDGNVSKICEVANGSSKGARSALYVLVIASILSLSCCLSTRAFFNWPIERIAAQEKALEIAMRKYDSVRSTIKVDTFCYLIDSLKNSVSIETRKLENLHRSKIDNYYTVRLPLIGSVFDINDLILISGIAFTILLYILRYVLKREKNNLQLALISIHSRYPDDANEDNPDFLKYINKHFPNEQQKALHRINRIRRKHHYNYLSMSEVFVIPPLGLDRNDEDTQVRTLTTFLSSTNLIFYIPGIIYVLIITNDLLGYFMNNYHTNENGILINFGISFIFLIIIWKLTFKCLDIKIGEFILYRDFYSNQYKYVKNDN